MFVAQRIGPTPVRVSSRIARVCRWIKPHFCANLKGMQEKIVQIIKEALGSVGEFDVSVPENDSFGHYSTNVAMRLAKSRGENPLKLAEDLAAKIAKAAPENFFEKVLAAPPGFINFWLSAETLQNEFARAAGEENFGRGDAGNGKTAIVEYSSVNVAKPFHLGHFRNTIIGDALANVLEFSGYKIVRWNYLGDWGTQFGKLVVAYRSWGNKESIEQNPIAELQKLYIRFHKEAEVSPELEENARQEFQKLEAGDAENRKLWEWFREESLVEFKKIYAALGVKFDVWIGESFFEPEMKFRFKVS